MKKKILAMALSFTLMVSILVPQIPVFAGTTTPAMTQIPGTTKVEKDYDETFLSVTGFGAEGVQDRSHYYDEYIANGSVDTENYVVVDEDCYMDADRNRIAASEYDLLEPTEQANYRWVTSEEQFAYGIANARVVEIRVDIEAGFKYYEENDIPTYGVIGPVSDYDKGNEPITNPVLMKTGISDITTKSHMTIFSPNGATIEHGAFNNNGVNDVIIRNLCIKGNYEWDDMPEGQQTGSTGNNKRYGWNNISNKDCNGIWIDHCTLGVAFDGNLDSKNSAQVTVTWCEIGVQDVSWDSDLGKTISYMEELYQKGEGFHLYTKYRKEGKTPEDLLEKAAQHKKVSIVSAGPDDYDVDPLDAVTMAYTKYVNGGSRIPAGMMCNAHMFNVWVANENYVDMKRCMNPHHGASMGADTCVFDNVAGAVIGREVDDEKNYVNNSGYDKLIGAISYQLIVNSKIRNNQTSMQWYEGSSWDSNGINPFTSQWTWSNKADSYLKTGEFKWAEWTPVAKLESELDEGEILITEGDAGKMADGEYYEKYYIGRDELGYDYQTFPLEDVEANLTAYAGAGKVTMENSGQWTKLYYGLEEEEAVVTYENLESKTEDVGTRIYAKGEAIGELPVLKKEGYTFLGWYETTLENGEFVVSDTPITEETIVTEDMVLREKWEIEKYTVTFDSTGGSTVAPLENVEHGQSFRGLGLDLPEATRDGFTFQGWYDAFDRNNAEKPFGGKLLKGTAFTENCTFYAKWKATKVDLIFNSNGGSQVQPMLDLNINTTTGLPEAPTKDGYAFAGWFYDEALTKEFVADSTKLTASLSYLIDIDGELNLYAKWEEVNEVTLTFDPMGGTTPDAITVTPAAAVCELPESTRPEYVFAGWYTDSTDYETEFTTASAIEADTTVYAKWVKKGDVNGDDVADALDALEILKGVAGMLPQSFTPLQMKQADVEADGSADALDALKILKVVAGMIVSFD